MQDVVNAINKKYTKISQRVTKAYEKTFGVRCDLYFPIFDPYNEVTKYRDMKIFTPHQSPTYSKEPDVRNAVFYIPFLIKKQSMNSSEVEFDSFYLENEVDRPFIETTKKRELPIATKVVVYQGQSISKFFVDKKLVVTGADGMMLLRMFLSPLAKDNDEDEEFQEETKIEGTDHSLENNSEEVGLGSTLGATRGVENSESEEQPKPKKRRGRRKKTTTNSDSVATVSDDLTMNIPEE